jgi:hypothetical protein
MQFLFLVLLVGLLLAACGGVTSDTPEVEDAGGGSETRVKESAEIGAAPRLFDANEVDGPAARGQAGITSDVAGVCLSAEEGELARMINEYRASLNLPPLQISKSLSLVAQQHAWDSVNNQNAWPTPPAGKTCNLHSWTGVVNPALQEGTWTAHCSFADHPNPNGLLDKPKEIAGTDMQGIENSFASSGTATPLGALTAWKNSPGHNAPMTQQNGWGPMAAMGVGMSGGVAHLWLGWVTDPVGEALLCTGGSAMTPPTAVPPTAVPPTAIPPTAEEATAAPPTAVPPTAIPATVAPTAAPTGTILNENGTIADGGTTEHTFNVAQGRTYTVLVTPSAEFDVDPSFDCTLASGGGASGNFDWHWEGEPETFTYAPPAGTGSCRITVGGYLGSTGTYTITVTAQ